jgi:tetratricopeptide (TPR) repeat protein
MTLFKRALFITLLAASWCPAEQELPVETLAKLPEVVLDRKSEFEAVVQELPARDDGLRRYGFAFKTPNLVDGPATWLVLWDHERPDTSAWEVTKPDGSVLAVVSPASANVGVDPDRTAKFPATQSLQRVRVGNHILVKATRYQAVLATTAKTPPLAILINVAADDRPSKPGEEIREMEIPEGSLTSQLVMDLVENIRHFHGDAAAIEFLESQFTKKAERLGEFNTLFTKVWHEAQFGTGMENPEWGSRLNDAAFISAYRIGHYAQAFDILNNLCARLGASARFGRLAEVHAIFEDAYRRGGQNMDPTSHPDLGPAIPSIPAIRHRKIEMAIPFSKQPPEGAPPISRVRPFGTIQVSALLYYAFQRMNRGDWQGAMEWAVWVRDWASDDMGVPIQSINEAWYSATIDLAIHLDNLGFTEEALALINEAVAAPYGGHYRGRMKINAAHRQLDLQRKVGRPDPEIIPKLREIVTVMENHVHFGRGSAWIVMMDLASAHFDAGQFEEGDRLLEQIIAEGCNNARWRRITRWIDTGRTEGVEAELIALLNMTRAGGHKVSEIWLYDKYADFLETTGRLQEALAMRQEAVRLSRDFNLFTKLPVHLAKLARLFHKLGHVDLASKAADEARALIQSETMPPGVVKSVNDVLAGITSAAPTIVAEELKPKVDLQPHRGIVVPIEGAPWAGYLTLTNPGTSAILGTLDISGPPHLAKAGGENGDIRVELGGAAGHGPRSALPLQLDPGSYRLITVAAGAAHAGEGEMKFVWRPTAGDPSAEATMSIDVREEGVAGAVIQAGDYQSNPFYGVPIHIAYVASDKPPQSPPIRFKSSQAARIEIHLLDGTPLAVDGTGNGSLLDSGDELFAQTDGAGNLRIAMVDGVAALKIIAYPRDPIAAEGLQIDIEVLDGAEWNLHSRNKVEP